MYFNFNKQNKNKKIYNKKMFYCLFYVYVYCYSTFFYFLYLLLILILINRIKQQNNINTVRHEVATFCK